MARPPLLLLCFCALSALAQTPCEGTPAYSPCEIAVRSIAADSGASNPYATVSLHSRISLAAFQNLSDAGILGRQPQ